MNNGCQGLSLPFQDRSRNFFRCLIYLFVQALFRVRPQAEFRGPGWRGEYQLHLFHERALPENLRFLERAITVPEGGLTLPLISISETGYIPAPHLDKHGKPYPPKSGYGAPGGQ